MNNITFESFKKMTNNAPIYKFYGPAVFAPPESSSVKNLNFAEDEVQTKFKYKCLYCEEHNIKDKKNNTVYISAYRNTTSNLIEHLKKENHAIAYNEYQEILKNNIPQNKKAKVGPSSSHSTPTMDRLKGPSTPISSKQPTLTRLGYVAASPRYEVGGILQKLRLVK